MKKLVKYKDYVFGDATDKDASKYTDRYEHCTDMREFNPPPRLLKIITDPKSAESKVYARNKEKHLENWLEDEGMLQKIVGIGQYIVDYNKETGEDINVILIFRKEVLKNYGKNVQARINEVLDGNYCTILTKDMDKDDVRDILEAKMPKKKLKKLDKRANKLAKKLYK